MHEAICLHPIEEGHPQTATEVLGELREEEKRQGTRRQIHYKKFLEFLRDATKSGSWSKIECRQRLGELMEEANKLGYESGYAKRQEEILETGEAILQVWREGSIIKNI